MKPRSNGRLIARKMLDSSQWFDGWDATDIDNFFRHSELREYDKSELLFRDGGGREILLLVTGSVWTCLRQENTQVKFGMLYPGALKGLSQLVRSMTPDEPCYEYIAAESTLALAIPQSALLDVMSTRPQLWRGIAEATIRYQRHCIKIALLLYTGSTRERLISALYQFGVSRSLVPSRPPNHQIMLSQGELSLLVQSSRPHVNKALRELETEGLIRLSYKRILVTRPDALADLATKRLATMAQ